MSFTLYLRHKGRLVRELIYASVGDALENGRTWLASGGQGFHIKTNYSRN